MYRQFGLEFTHLSKFDIKLLDFNFNHLSMKLFKTTNISIINNCRLYFGTKPPSESLLKRRENTSSRLIAWTIFLVQNVRLTLSISTLI